MTSWQPTIPGALMHTLRNAAAALTCGDNGFTLTDRVASCYHGLKSDIKLIIILMGRDNTMIYQPTITDLTPANRADILAKVVTLAAEQTTNIGDLTPANRAKVLAKLVTLETNDH